METKVSDWPDIIDSRELNARLAQTWLRKLVHTGGTGSTGTSIPAHITAERGYRAGDEVVTYLSMVDPDVYCVWLPPRD